MSDTKKPIDYIQLTFPDGSVWRLDTEEIARDRARHYSRLDYDRGDVTDLNQAFVDEYQYTITDDYELIDWLNNNYNWEDIKRYATLIESPKSDYAKWFMNDCKKVAKRGDQ